MIGGEDIESYLLRMDAQHSVVGQGIWLVKDGSFDMVISISEPLLVFRVKLLELGSVPAAKRELFFQTLLELNASEMVHGAYGLEEGAVVVTDALQLAPEFGAETPERQRREPRIDRPVRIAMDERLEQV